jgi:hypothetical protein
MIFWVLATRLESLSDSIYFEEASFVLWAQVRRHSEVVSISESETLEIDCFSGRA